MKNEFAACIGEDVQKRYVRQNAGFMGTCCERMSCLFDVQHTPRVVRYETEQGLQSMICHPRFPLSAAKATATTVRFPKMPMPIDCPRYCTCHGPRSAGSILEREGTARLQGLDSHTALPQPFDDNPAAPVVRASVVLHPPSTPQA